jgi:Lhr-like helicase
MSNKTILASYCSENGNGKEVKITIDDYNAFLKIKDEAERKAKISEMIYYRFYDRYIKPFEYESKDYEKCYKNGFAMMASGCLLIETLESFYEGLGDTKRGSKEMLKSFLKERKVFLEILIPINFTKMFVAEYCIRLKRPKVIKYLEKAPFLMKRQKQLMPQNF